VTYKAIYNLFFSPLKQIPGPTLWALSSTPYVYYEVRGIIVYKLLALHEKYGGVVRVAPDQISYANEDAWRDVWAHRQGHQEFPKAYSAPSLNGVYGILTANRENHSRFRRLLSHSFSEAAVREQQSNIQMYVDLLTKDLKNHAAEGPQNIVKWLNWTSFDIISHLAFGECFGCLEESNTHPWISAIFGNIKALTTMNALRQLGAGLVLPYLVPPKAKALRKYNWDYSSKKIEDRLKRGSSEGDFWDHVLRKSEVSKPASGMSVEEMKSNASHIVLAGSETTSTLLSGCIWYLLRNPDTMAKTVQEIRSNFKSTEDINLFSLMDLKYTEAVLEETMRIYPPVPIQSARTVPAGGDTVSGVFLPGGTRIVVAQYVPNHLHSNFSKPDKFIPERFLGAKEFENDNYAVLKPFSVGPRNCIGRNLANAEMRLILTKLLYNFDLELDKRSINWIQGQKTYSLWEKPPLWIVVKPAN
jgi:averantin hydroxylase